MKLSARLGLALCLGFLCSHSALGLDEENPLEVRASWNQVKSQIKKVEKKLYHTKRQERQLIQQLAHLDKAIGESAQQLRKHNEQKNQNTRVLQSLKKKEADLIQQRKAQQAALTELLQATFRHHQKEKLKLMFNHSDWGSLNRTQHYYDFFTQARANQITALQKNLQDIHSVEQSVKKKKKAISTQATLHAKELGLFTSQKEERQRLLKKLSSSRHGNQSRLSQLQKQEQHLFELFQILQKRLSQTPTYIDPAQDFSKMKQRLLLPIRHPGASLTPLPYQDNTTNKKSYIAADNGTPVLAIFPGKVVFSDWLRGIGLLIILDHGSGYMSLYGNNETLYKNVGDWVNLGEMISRVGQSGGHAEPGLYFEIRKGTQALDPTPWFAVG